MASRYETLSVTSWRRDSAKTRLLAPNLASLQAYLILGAFEGIKEEEWILWTRAKHTQAHLTTLGRDHEKGRASHLPPSLLHAQKWNEMTAGAIANEANRNWRKRPASRLTVRKGPPPPSSLSIFAWKRETAPRSVLSSSFGPPPLNKQISGEAREFLKAERETSSSWKTIQNGERGERGSRSKKKQPILLLFVREEQKWQDDVMKLRNRQVTGYWHSSSSIQYCGSLRTQFSVCESWAKTRDRNMERKKKVGRKFYLSRIRGEKREEARGWLPRKERTLVEARKQLLKAGVSIWSAKKQSIYLFPSFTRSRRKYFCCTDAKCNLSIIPLMLLLS